jgi:hypothetical protein
MKPLFFLLSFLFILCLPPLKAQQVPFAPLLESTAEGSQNIPATTMEFDQQTQDFGLVIEGEIVTKVFTFTNTGTAPLIITDARGSCGCTVPARPMAPIAPGETASITVQFNSKNKKGARKQKVTITANTEPAQTFIYITGEVEPDSDWGVNQEIDNVAGLSSTKAKVPKDCFVIHPNPTAEVLKLRMEEENFGQKAEVIILSLEGQIMARRQVEIIVEDVAFDVSHYPAGTYHARVAIGEMKPVSQCFVVAK